MRLLMAVPTLNGHNRVTRLLRSMLEQRLPPSLEILIVDNGSSPPLDLARLPVPGVPMNLARTERPGLSMARNAALASSRPGDVVIFVDDDMVLGDGFFFHYEKCFSDSSVEAAGGQIVPVFPHRKPPWYFGRFRAFYGRHKRDADYRYAGDTPYGGNFGVRYRDSLQPFNPDFGIGGQQALLGEEVLFFRNNRFEHVAYVDEAVAFHQIEPENCTFRWFMRRLIRVFRTRLRYPD